MNMIAICSDHAGYELKSIIEGYLEANNKEFEDFGTSSADSCDYPDFAHPCAVAVESGRCYPGIAMCGSGNGIAMTLNKHQGIRAALCWNTELAELARKHNDANVLVLPARFIRPGSGFGHCGRIPGHTLRGWASSAPNRQDSRRLNMDVI